MIIVKLMGGLGNQMFQYAFGRYLAEKNNVELKLDLSFLEDKSHRLNFTYRKYELGAFKINESFITQKEIKKFRSVKFQKLPISLIGIINRLFPLYSRINEKDLQFNPVYLTAPDNSLVDGFWQSEKYFKDIAEILSHDFDFKKSAEGRIAELQKEIEEGNSVSIHVRRGDYVTNKITNSIHGVCSLDYYQDAIKFIASKVKEPRFYIFSDDIQWTKENLEIPFSHYFVEYDFPVEALEDMRLMRLCKHQIIANSSFSWWAAWLNKNGEKIVVAPKNWFADPSKRTNDLIPDSWIKI